MSSKRPYTSEPQICSGTLVFAGTRVLVKSLFDHLEAGDSIDDFIDGFQTVRRDHVISVLEEAQRGILKAA